MQQLNPNDLAWCLRRTPKKVLELLKLYPGKFCVAGGFIRSCIANEKINDVDIFASDASYAALGADFLAEGKGNNGIGRGRIHKTDNAYTIFGYVTTPQIIHRWTFPNPRDVVPSFDFTIACAAFWWGSELTGKYGNFSVSAPEWTSLCDSDFYSDLAAKRLVYRSPDRNEDAGGSLLRVLKFYSRGYRIPLDSMGAVIARLCQGVKWNEVARDASLLKISEEEQLGEVLSGLLREIDPTLDPSHIAHLPSIKAARNLGKAPIEEGTDE
jgi:hypothetical protein